LDAKNEGLTDQTKREYFLKKLVDDDYDGEKRILSQKNADFDECVSTIRKREQTLDAEADASQSKRARRGRENGGRSGKDGGDSKSEDAIPYIPHAILNQIKDKAVRSDLLKWRSIYNSEKRQIRTDELTGTAKNAGTNSNGSDKNRNTQSSGGKDPKKNRGSHVKKARRTATGESGLKSNTATVGFKDDSDADDSSDASDESDDSKESPAKSRNGSSKSKKKGKKSSAKRKRHNPVARRGYATSEKPKGIIDPGTDFEVIGGVGWEVLTKLNRTTCLEGALEGMRGSELPVVSAVTAYDHKELGTVLLGVGAVAYDERTSQTETLLNSHYLRDQGVTVSDVSKKHNGLQMLEVDGIQVDLTFDDDERILYFPLRRPTAKEVQDLTIHWLIPQTPDSYSKLLVRRNKAAIVPEPAPWRERLGNCPEAVTGKTLQRLRS
jgi:hypothetical protein